LKKSSPAEGEKKSKKKDKKKSKEPAQEVQPKKAAKHQPIEKPALVDDFKVVSKKEKNETRRPVDSDDYGSELSHD